jgi:hypothetical protein
MWQNELPEQNDEYEQQAGIERRIAKQMPISFAKRRPRYPAR